MTLFVEKLEKSFYSLRKMLYSDEWPIACDCLCDLDSQADRSERGRSIIESFFGNSLEGRRVLDFGCGDGYTTWHASQSAELCVGYDSVPQWQVSDRSEMVLTDNWDEVCERGPYDLILAFDVLDHLVDYKQAFYKMSDVLGSNGSIHLRLHPYLSRHSIHACHYLNKAFVHLVFSPLELSHILSKSWTIRPNYWSVTTPMKDYPAFFESYGFFVKSHLVIKNCVEEFFFRPEISQRIIANSGFEVMPEFQMSIEFVDYVISRSYEG